MSEDIKLVQDVFYLVILMFRSVTAHAEISYVSTKNEKEEEFELETVKGSHSTKVEAVLKCLMRIRTEDEEAKSLVFSTWPDVLDILATALDENDIPYAALHKNTSTTQSKYKRNIQKFKVSTENFGNL